MKRLIISLFLTIYALGGVVGQNITGCLVDDNKAPIPYANVVLLSLPDSIFLGGVVTDDSGYFCFEKPDSRGKLVRISSIGYETAEFLLTKKELGTLILKTATMMLDEAVVVGRRPTYSLKQGTLTTNVENTLLSSLGTANDVLKRVPGLQINDGDVTVFGKGTPLIYINGRQVRDLSELEQLNSKEIAKVELIINPGAEYDAEVKAVLRIKTVKPVGEGIGGSVRTALQKGELWSNNQQVALNYRKQKLDIFGSLYYDKKRRIEKQEDLQTVYADQVLEINGKSRSPLSLDYIQGEGGLNYQLDDKSSVGLRYTINHSSSKSSVPDNYEVKLDGAPYDHLDFMNRMNGDGDTHKVNAYYTGMWGSKLGVDLNIDWLYGDSESNQNITEHSTAEGEQTVHARSASRNNLYAGKLVFSYPVAKGTLKFGPEVSFTNRHSSYVNKEQILEDSHSKATSDNQSVFISYDVPINKAYLSAGLRYEHVSFAYYEEDIKQEEQSKDYNNIFPSLSIFFPVKEWQFSLGYAARTKRPTYSALRSDIQYANRYTYERGNPSLQPETEHNISFQTMYKYVQFSIYYSYTKDAILSVTYPYKEDNLVTVFGIENISKWQAYGASLSVAPKIGIWEPIWNFEFMRQVLEGKYLGKQKHFNRPAIAASLTNQLRLPWGLIFSADISCSNKYHSGYVLNKANMWVDCGLRKAFLGGALNVSLQANDIFASMRNSFINYGEIMTFDKWNYNDSRQVRLRVSYRFNASRSKYKGTGAGEDEKARI